jgi:hypothetical protein
MRRPFALTLVAIALLVGSCGSDDDPSGPENQPPEFADAPSGVLPGGLLLNVVPGDRIAFTARGIDPDVEPITYLWELGRLDGSEFVPVSDAGNLTDETTASATWTVTDFDEPVRVRCTISDGTASYSELVGRRFSSGTPLTGTIDADRTLTAADAPYVVSGDLTVAAGTTLSIEAGVAIQVRPDRATGEWTKRSIVVEGEVVANGLLQNPVLVRGGYSSDPDPGGGGTQQLRGIVLADGGSASLSFVRVQEADIGLRILSEVPTLIEFCNFTSCGTGVQVERGQGTTLRSVLFRDNSIGLQLNNAAIAMEGGTFESCSAFGLSVDAATANAGLDLRGVTFKSNLQAHLRMSGEFGNLITATVRGSNFLQQSAGTSAINLASNCSVYALDLRGNFWGRPVDDPADIRDMFAGKQFCDAGVMGWTDFDCGVNPNPDDCDWSNVEW